MTNSRPHRYRLFIDESGDHTWPKPTATPAYRYLSLLGVWFEQEDAYVKFSSELEKFKLDIFGARPDPIVFHRKDIINRKGPFGVLNDASKRAEFDARLIGIIAASDFKMCSVVVDKLWLMQTYSSPFHPYHFALAALLDRYCGWLNYKSGVGDVMAESRGRQEDMQLSGAYSRVYENGTLMFKSPRHSQVLTSKSIKIRLKAANDAGLQLADVLAYPVKTMMLEENGAEGIVQAPFGQRVIESAIQKFNSASARIDGYGKVWLGSKKR